MKIKLVFDDNVPEDMETHARMMKALDMALVLWSIDTTVFRDRLKYGDFDDKQQELLEVLREEIRQLCKSHGVDIEDLIS